MNQIRNRRKPTLESVRKTQAAHALSQLNVEPDIWVRQVRGVGSGYWRAVGHVEQLLAKAAAMGQRWLKGVSYALALTS